MARQPTDEIGDDVGSDAAIASGSNYADSDGAIASASNGRSDARRGELGGGSRFSAGGRSRLSVGTSEAAAASVPRDPVTERRRSEMGASPSPRPVPVYGELAERLRERADDGAAADDPLPSPKGGGREGVPEFMRVALKKRSAEPQEKREGSFAARAAVFEAKKPSSPRTVPSPSSLSRAPRGSLGSRASIGSRGSAGGASSPVAAETGGRTSLVSEWAERARGAAPLVPGFTPPKSQGRKRIDPSPKRDPSPDREQVVHAQQRHEQHSQQQRQSPQRGTTYDTAVEAARHAIQTSNRGRVVVGNDSIDTELQQQLRGRQERVDGPRVSPREAGLVAKFTQDLADDDDPGLTDMGPSPGPSPDSSVHDDEAVVAGGNNDRRPSPVQTGYAQEEEEEEYSYAEEEYKDDPSDETDEDEEYYGEAGGAKPRADQPAEQERYDDGFDSLRPRASDGPIDYFATDDDGYGYGGGGGGGDDDVAFDAFGPSFADDAVFPPQQSEQVVSQQGDPFGSSDPFDPFSTAAFSCQNGPADGQRAEETRAEAGPREGLSLVSRAMAAVTKSEKKEAAVANDDPPFQADFGDVGPEQSAPLPPPGSPLASGDMSDVSASGVSRSSSDEGSARRDTGHHRRLSSEFEVDANLLSPLGGAEDDGAEGRRHGRASSEFAVDADLLSPTESGESSGSYGRLHVVTNSLSPVEGGESSEAARAAARPMISPSRPSAPAGSSAAGTFDVTPTGLALFEDPRDAHRLPAPTASPVSGNLIVARCDSRGRLSVAEVGPLPSTYDGAPPTVTSAHVLTDELRSKVARSTGGRVVGVRSVASLAAGTHRVGGGRRVRVAAVADLVLVGGPSDGSGGRGGTTGGTTTVPFVLVWKWDYEKTGSASLQSALSLSTLSSGLFAHDATTLQVADGLVLLGGRAGPNPCVFAAKPAVRDGWLPVEVADTRAKSVTCLAASNEGGRHLLAVGLNDGTVRVAGYDGAVRTNRIGTESAHFAEGEGGLLRTVCRLRGIMDVDGEFGHGIRELTA